jgi:hypothetical protein
LTLLTLLTLLTRLSLLTLLAIRRVGLIRILWRMLRGILLLAFATGMAMLLLLAPRRWWPLLWRSATPRTIGRAPLTLAATRRRILMRALWLARRSTGRLGAALTGALLLVDPDGDTTAGRCLFRIEHGRRPDGGCVRCHASCVM